MSHSNINQARRKVLKGAAYLSALSATGLSSLALAKKDNSAAAVMTPDNSFSANGAIRIIQETQFDREKVTLINESNKLQMIDARRPISLHQVNGLLVVTVNQNDADAVNGMVLMSPNERFTFDVKAVGLDLGEAKDIPVLTNLAENQLEIVSEHSVFNRILPVELA